MARLTFSKRARSNLVTIGDWIARDNPARAVSFVQELRSICATLLDFPLAFPVVGSIKGGPVRKRVAGNYLILYEVDGSDVQILTILHGARNLDDLLD